MFAAELKVSVQTIYDLRSKGRGPHGFRVGTQLRFRKTEIDAWVERREQADRNATPAGGMNGGRPRTPDRLLLDHQRHQARHLLCGSRAHPRRRRAPAQSHRCCSHRIGGSSPLEGASPRQAQIWDRWAAGPQQLFPGSRRSLARGSGTGSQPRSSCLARRTAQWRRTGR